MKIKYLENYIDANIVLENIYHIKIEKNNKSEKTNTNKEQCGIVVPIKGKALYEVDGSKYFLSRGKVLFCGADIPLSKYVLGDSNWEYYLLHYNFAHESMEDNALWSNHFLINTGNNIEGIIKNLEQLKNEPDNLLDKFKNKTKILEVIYQIFEKSLWYNSSTEEEMIFKIINYIEENYYKEITVSNLASMVDMDEKTFAYTFHKYMDSSPKKYVVNLRLTKAKRLLRNSTYKVNEIANLVGYEDPYNFSKIFKRYNGVSPKEYKNELEKRHENF